ncbi:MAG TPA: hypothetical protein DCG69_06625 [Bacteroidales bacterium]|nr:hypothetical protein [Bacteroidales bacterium]
MYFLIWIILILASGFFYFSSIVKLGERSKIVLKNRAFVSSNYQSDRFHNLVNTPMAAPKFSTMIKFFFKGENQIPKNKLVTQLFRKAEFEASKEMVFSWFGHSTVLLKMENITFLIDPVFGKRASLFTFLGPKRFRYTNTHRLNDLPMIDVVLISHDHFDHLEYETILALKENVKRFFVPLGVGAHLEKWGVSKEKISELDWWEEINLNEDIKFVFTPTRHFSGRSVVVRNQTLWGSWSIIGKTQKVFFSGDSGYFDVFEKIGEKYGPFDLAFIENGQYNEDWSSIHMMPEQSAKVGFELKAKQVVPIHWGKFSLSVHAWTAPVERFLAASKEYSFAVLTPAPGEIVPLSNSKSEDWWKN